MGPNAGMPSASSAATSRVVAAWLETTNTASAPKSAHRLAGECEQVGLATLGRVPDQGVGLRGATSSTSASP